MIFGDFFTFFFQDQDTLLHELRSHRFFDVFEYNGVAQHWGCFLCNHPDRARDFMQVGGGVGVPQSGLEATFSLSLFWEPETVSFKKKKKNRFAKFVFSSGVRLILVRTALGPRASSSSARSHHYATSSAPCYFLTCFFVRNPQLSRRCNYMYIS